MRVEQQGHIGVQPTYQHVGYTSAIAWSAYLRTDYSGPSAYGVGLLVALAGAVIARRAPSLRWLAALLLLSGVGVGVWGWSRGPATRRLEPRYYSTLRTLEAACALTEQQVAELGRLPTPEEWRAAVAGMGCAADGWGGALRYEVLPAPSNYDDQWYRITGGLGRHGAPAEPDRLVWGVTSSDLGCDGVFGTADDHGTLADVHGDWTIPGRYAHGREPRAPLG
jgi:hypothetical protein